MSKIRDRLSRNTATSILGRDHELSVLARLFDDEAPLVVHMHGGSGIGKTTLLRSFAAQAPGRGCSVVLIDGAAVEPTPSGFMAELGRHLGQGDVAMDGLANRIASHSRLILALDNYESLRLLDTWLCQEFLPAMPDSLRVGLAGRLPPSSHWLIAPEWQGLFHPLPLKPLSDETARRLVARFGLPGETARRIVAFAHGNPLALTLAGRLAAKETPEKGAPLDGVLHHLSRLYLDGVEDETVREGLRATCVVRRITRPLLEVLRPAGSDNLIDRIARLPFIEGDAGGLTMTEAVREALAADFEACDPEGFRKCRRTAWRHLAQAASSAGDGDLWRYTADLIYILRNPVVREAFFPRNTPLLSVQPARPEHAEAIRAISCRHETPEAARLLENWWARAPRHFSVILHEDGAVAGFYILFDTAHVPETLLRDDPITYQWWRHLKDNRIPANQTALFIRRWLGEIDGERPSPVQAAAWLDIKRHYLEMRPRLRRVYLGLADPAPYAQVAERLGFSLLPKYRAKVGEAAFESAVLDMGAASVEGWLSWLMACELGADEGEVLDIAGKVLRIQDETIPLTRLEFEVMRYLWLRRGAVVPRQELLDNVWGHHFDGGSNVVDTVIAGLRRKLGSRADMIGTQRGQGYVCR